MKTPTAAIPAVRAFPVRAAWAAGVHARRALVRSLTCPQRAPASVSRDLGYQDRLRKPSALSRVNRAGSAGSAMSRRPEAGPTASSAPQVRACPPAAARHHWIPGRTSFSMVSSAAVGRQGHGSSPLLIPTGTYCPYLINSASVDCPTNAYCPAGSSAPTYCSSLFGPTPAHDVRTAQGRGRAGATPVLNAWM